MAITDDYITGTITISGVIVTGSGTAWRLANIQPGDTLVAAGWFGIVSTVESNDLLTLLDWAGPELTNSEYLLRYQPDGTRVAGRAQQLIDLLSDSGNLEAFAALNGNVDLVPYFTGNGTMGLIATGDIVSAGLRPRGPYNAATTYAQGDLVTYDDRSFASIANDNVGNTPPNSATSTTFWMYVAVAPGPKGDPGDEIELRTNTTHIQWRYVGAATWTNLVALTTITGPQGDAIELQTSATHIQWRYVGDATWTDLVPLSAITGPKGDDFTPDAVGTLADRSNYDGEQVGFAFLATDAEMLYFRIEPSGWSDGYPFGKGEKGDDGREIELQTSATHIQWRYVGDTVWIDLVPLSAITGPQGNDGDEIELQTSATHIQWRYVGDTVWIDLVALAAITGPAGTTDYLELINRPTLGNSSSLDVGTVSGTVAAGDDARIVGAQQMSAKGAANGYASLDSTAKVPMSQIPDALIGSVQYAGTWNAATNTPTIPAAATTNKGEYYIVDVAGTTVIDGVNDWEIGDWIISDGSVWSKIDNTDQVMSVAGKRGDVDLVKADVGLDSVDNTSDANKPVSTAQQTALNLKANADLTNVDQSVARAKVGAGSMAYRDVTISTANPSGGADGDIWLKV